MVFCSILVSLRHPLSTQTSCGKMSQNIEQLFFLMKTATSIFCYERLGLFYPRDCRIKSYQKLIKCDFWDLNPRLLNRKSRGVPLQFVRVFIKLSKNNLKPAFRLQLFTSRLFILIMSYCGVLQQHFNCLKIFSTVSTECHFTTKTLIHTRIQWFCFTFP